jgi:hypothetical protein
MERDIEIISGDGLVQRLGCCFYIGKKPAPPFSRGGDDKDRALYAV